MKVLPSFLWVYSFFSALSLPLALFSLPPPLRLLMIHSLFKHGRLLRASGNEVPAHLRRADFGLQLFPHVGHRYLHVAPSVCPPGKAREDKRLVSCAQQPLRVDPGEGMITAEKRLYWSKTAVSLTVFFVPSPGRSGEAKASDGHHHSGGQGLRGGAVCVSV